MTEHIEQEVTNEIYESISENKIAEIIKEYYNIKVTDTLIESYVELASSNLFNVDPVVYEIRKLNKVDTVIENQFFLGRDNNYQLERRNDKFGTSVSFLCKTHMTRADKVGLSKQRL